MSDSISGLGLTKSALLADCCSTKVSRQALSSVSQCLFVFFCDGVTPDLTRESGDIFPPKNDGGDSRAVRVEAQETISH